MLQELLAGATFGTLLGIIAGITPGIHSNTFAAILIAFSPEIAGYIGMKGLAFSVISSAVAYTIADIIPTTFLGVPDEETAISVLPSHKMVLDGRGFEAISISAFSSLLSVFLAFPLYVTVIALTGFYHFVAKLTPFFLFLISAVLILSERGEEFEGSWSVWRKRLYALLIFTLSAILGWVALENHKLAEISPASSILLPLLTGLFGAPVLLESASGKLPEQKLEFKIPEIDPVAKGTLAGLIVSIFPAISSGVATVLASFNERSEERFISAMSAANTSNAIMCIFMLMTLGKARSGTAVALKGILTPSFYDVILISVISAIFSFCATVLIARILSSRIHILTQSEISFPVLTFLIFLTLTLTGFFGFAIFLAALPIGLLAARLKVKRTNCMGCLIVPVLLRYI